MCESPSALRKVGIGGEKFHVARSSECDVKRVGRRDAVGDHVSFQQEARQPDPLGGEPGQTDNDRVEPSASQLALPEQPAKRPIDLNVEMPRNDDALVRDRRSGCDADW